MSSVIEFPPGNTEVPTPGSGDDKMTRTNEIKKQMTKKEINKAKNPPFERIKTNKVLIGQIRKNKRNIYQQYWE